MAEEDQTTKADTVKYFTNALEKLSVGIALLRTLKPVAANEATKHVHALSDIFMSALLDSEPTLDNVAHDQNGDSALRVSDGPAWTNGAGVASNSKARLVEKLRSSSMSNIPNSHEVPSSPWPLLTGARAPQVSMRPMRTPHGHTQDLVFDLKTPGTRPTNGIPGISWARVAALEEPLSQASNVARAARPTPYGGTLSRSPSAISEPLAAQSRVIWVFHCPPSMSLSDITSKIHKGSLMSIVFATDRVTNIRACCIIFYNAEDAQVLMMDHRLHIGRREHTFFRSEHVEVGAPYPADEDIRMMNPPIGARRRLTVVRKALFETVSKAAFKRDINHLAGEDNVELVFIYNTGNATVVLASVKCAMLVKTGLEAKAKKRGMYEGATVSFSRDPCEAELRLVSVFN
ncbi:MAG: hypothetical protein M1833_002197 [Piccolia ochrophora]|nr:MAG: hypothetical protein M1833_002197 [Piccolia ochrophora]